MPAQLDTRRGTQTTAIAIAPKQEERRTRIVVAASRLAAHGREAVQIRQVADRANVAPSTVYRYFASKDDLLVACLHQWLLRISCGIPGFTETTDPVGRLLMVIEMVTTELCTQPLLADATVRAYLYANTEAAENTELCRNLLIRTFTAALDGVHDEQTRYAGELITDIWATNLPAMIQRRTSVDDLLDRLERAATAMVRCWRLPARV